jgi:hypothetical protein
MSYLQPPIVVNTPTHFYIEPLSKYTELHIVTVRIPHSSARCLCGSRRGYFSPQRVVGTSHAVR